MKWIQDFIQARKKIQQLKNIIEEGEEHTKRLNGDKINISNAYNELVGIHAQTKKDLSSLKSLVDHINHFLINISSIELNLSDPITTLFLNQTRGASTNPIGASTLLDVQRKVRSRDGEIAEYKLELKHTIDEKQHLGLSNEKLLQENQDLRLLLREISLHTSTDKGVHDLKDYLKKGKDE